jgi:Ca2+/Na+ antiporter
MIQRIQSLYLIIVAILTGVLPFFFNLWLHVDGTEVFAKNEMLISIAFYVSTVLAIWAMVQFKNRKSQFVINRLNMILNVFLLGFFVYRSLNLSGETLVSEKGIGMLIPVFSIIFLVLANKAIKKDEDLVKSVDRLR